MFSLKLSNGSLEALRQTEVMLKQISRLCTGSPQELLDVSISGDGFGKPAVGDRRTYRLNGKVGRGRQMLKAKVILELQYSAELRWQPCIARLRIADEYYSSTFGEDDVYVRKDDFFSFTR